MELELDEVIENLEYLVSDSCTDTQFDYIEEIEIATKSLKKQILQKVQEKHIDEYICPACGEENSGYQRKDSGCSAKDNTVGY